MDFARIGAFVKRFAEALRSRTFLGLLLAGDVAYKALAVFFPEIHGHGFNSDEAVIGLMGLRSIEQGDFALFFYGQSFGGALEYLLTTMAFWALPPSILVLRLVALAMRLACDILFYRILAGCFDDKLQRHAALLLFVALSSHFHAYMAPLSGVHLNNLLLGLAIVHLFSAAEGPLDRPIPKGIAIGLGFWASDAILLFLLPALAVAALRWARPRPLRVAVEMRKLGLLLLAAAAAAGPRLAYLLNPDSWVVSYRAGGFSLVGWSNARDRLGSLLSDTLPRYLYDGLIEAELGRLALAAALLVASLCLAATAVAAAGFFRREERSRAPAVLAGVFWLTLLAFVANGEVYDAGLRYLIPIQPFAALAAPLVFRLRASWLVVITLAFAMLGIASSFLLDSEDDASKARAHEQIIELLRASDVHHGWADYWAGYDIAFRTREDIALAPLYVSRIPGYAEAARRARTKAYVFLVEPPSDSPAVRRALRVNAAALRHFQQRWEKGEAHTRSSRIGRYLVVVESPG
jgi:hypothetical protein